MGRLASLYLYTIGQHSGAYLLHLAIATWESTSITLALHSTNLGEIQYHIDLLVLAILYPVLSCALNPLRRMHFNNCHRSVTGWLIYDTWGGISKEDRAQCLCVGWTSQLLFTISFSSQQSVSRLLLLLFRTSPRIVAAFDNCATKPPVLLQVSVRWRCQPAANLTDHTQPSLVLLAELHLQLDRYMRTSLCYAMVWSA